jgi:hypothetical protein
MHLLLLVQLHLPELCQHLLIAGFKVDPNLFYDFIEHILFLLLILLFLFLDGICHGLFGSLLRLVFGRVHFLDEFD